MTDNLDAQQGEGVVSEVFTRLLKRWRVLVLGGLLGGLFGLVFTAIRPPVYESAGVLAINIDYGRTEPLALVVEDRALDRVWGLITSDETLEEARKQLTDSLGSSREWASLATLRDHTRLDNKLSRWELVGISSDPKRAAAIASSWTDVALQRLQDAYEHAWNAFRLQGKVFSLACVQTMSGQPEQALWDCFAHGPDVRPEDVAALRTEIDASHGILPILSFEKTHTATIPQQPILWGRATVVLASALAGLLLALGAATLDYPRMRPKSVRPLHASTIS